MVMTRFKDKEGKYFWKNVKEEVKEVKDKPKAVKKNKKE